MAGRRALRGRPAPATPRHFGARRAALADEVVSAPSADDLDYDSDDLDGTSHLDDDDDEDGFGETNDADFDYALYADADDDDEEDVEDEDLDDDDSSVEDAEEAQAESETTPRPKRTDIQALRALAVIAVIINHLWPLRMPGGYIGVDVFFAISGFLITSHLLAEFERDGRLHLARFYAKRARRLLPAAFLVLAVSAIVVFIALPYPRWGRTGIEIVAAAAYVENLYLAARSVDYLAATDVPTVAQHYWSLSVEEQFYLVWPLLLIALIAMTRKHAPPGRRSLIADDRPRRARRSLAIGMTLVALSSLALSVWWTDVSPAAYFVSPVRFWEFALGGLLALVATGRARPLLPGWLAQIVSFLGLGVLIVSCFRFTSETVFPGWTAAIPVTATLLVIAAGSGRERLAHTALTGIAPIQWIGNVSYSLYLWHWPLIVITPYLIHDVLSWPVKLAILAFSGALAGATKVSVEDPGLTWHWAMTRHRRTFSAMTTGILALSLMGSGLVGAAAASNSGTTGIVVAETKDCRGPAALDAANECPDPFGPAENPYITPVNSFTEMPDACVDHLGDNRLFNESRWTCDGSDGDPQAITIWLVGDSHAQQWGWALATIALERGWRLETATLGGCPLTDLDRTNFEVAYIEECRSWRPRIVQTIITERPDTIFLSYFSRAENINDGTGRSQLAQHTDAINRFWQPWVMSLIPIVTLGDIPLNDAIGDPECSLIHANDPLACARDRSIAQPGDPLLIAAARSAATGAWVGSIDLTDQFCDETLCYSVIGGVSVYYDGNHLNREYTDLLVPALAEAIDATKAVPKR
ncbi:MAG: acyltransferase [Propionibacteriaceae bacterium]|nr:acyltransferase [Propionibacteriaceae bacterium]